MASRAHSLPTNADGDFFVDSTCIDCDTCRWMAPETFDRLDDKSRVHTQPSAPASIERALLALVACPTGSIGTGAGYDLASASRAFPVLVEDDVFHCGYHAEESFGAASYLIRRPRERGGNVLVDSPRFSQPLVRRLEDLGGVATMFLTHIDDVADHARFGAHFGCERVLHAADRTDETRDIERWIDGLEPVSLDPELVVVPVPGHTRGSSCLLYRDRFLFSGDHVAWSRGSARIYAFRNACWYDWDAQCDSMERLARHRFEWILPGHGTRCRFPQSEMSSRVQACIEWMRSAPARSGADVELAD